MFLCIRGCYSQFGGVAPELDQAALDLAQEEAAESESALSSELQPELDQWSV